MSGLMRFPENTSKNHKFLESLGMREHSEIMSTIFGHNQDDQKGQEYPTKSNLKDISVLMI